MSKTLLALLTVAIMTLASCSNNEENYAEENSQIGSVSHVIDPAAFQVVKDSIASYGYNNFQICYHNTASAAVEGQSTMRKSVWTWFKKVLTVVTKVFKADSDAYSEIEGSTWVKVLYSVASSLKEVDCQLSTNKKGKATATNTSPSKAPLINNDSTSLNVSVLPPSAYTVSTVNDSAGYYHNLVITNMAKKDSITYESLEKMDDEELITKIENEVENIFALPEGTLQKDTVLNEQIIESLNNSFTKSESSGIFSISTAKEQQLNEVMKVIDTYLEGLYEIQDPTSEQWTQYTLGVMDIINKSNLDSDDKEMLKVTLNVTFASSKLWNMGAFQEILEE